MAPATEASFLKCNKEFINHSSIKRHPTSTDIPKWMDEEFFTDILRKNAIHFTRISKCSISPTTNAAAGEKHASTILRVYLQIELEDMKLKKFVFIFKTLPDSVKALVTSFRLKLFERETLVYRKFIPEFEEFYRKIGKHIKFAPASYEFPKHPGFEGILLENLYESGFKKANRLEGLDMEHTKCVLRKLAELHAASALHYSLNGNYPTAFERGFVTQENRAMFEQIAEERSHFLLDCMEKYHLDSDAKRKIKKLRTSHTDLYIKYSEIHDGDFNVLNHGDCWLNNILFRYDAFGKIKQTLFIDFQVSKYGSFAQDLYFFLFSSTKFDLKLKYFDSFIQFYYENLIENLKLLNYSKNIPTLKELNMELNKYCFWGYLACTSILAATLFDGTESEFLRPSDDIDYRELMFSNPRYVKQIEAIVPWLNDRYAMIELN